MIELELQATEEDPTGFYGQLWSNEANTHVIAEEDGRFFVRDEGRLAGPYPSLETALTLAHTFWGEVTLAPANRLRHNIDVEDECDGMRYLTEYLAAYGTAGIDAQALAQRVFERLEED